jgi:CysZ protein
MGILRGLRYNWNGLRLALRTPRLLALGLVRLAAVLAATVVGVGLSMAYHEPLLAAIWSRPESLWIVWLWYLASWLLALLLIVAAALAGYLAAQVLFAVLVMDLMSRYTERIATGREAPPPAMRYWRWFLFLVAQEVPRAVVPLLISLILLIGGWVTPLGPLLAVVSAGVAAIFMAWDCSDLVPARRMEPFSRRFGRLKASLGLHLGFGLWFLVPGLNLVFLAFAPVGGTLMALETMGEAPGGNPLANELKRTRQ